MSSIVIGKSGTRNVTMDVDVLLRTRLLVQANSGQGKSYLLRRLAEQLFGKIQLIIIDPDGEFATLRERFDFVLIGEGGDAPIHIPSAKLLAHRLLELRASAICNIYDGVQPQARHEWVRNFLDGLVDSPKKLWHPCGVIVDEAHKFAPERKSGESCASEAMIRLATDGRKRGQCAIFATQRLAKLDKNASAELLNRLVGGTFEDVDIDRALDLLSVARDDVHEFKKSLKVLEPGEFYAIGRAITKERLLLKVGAVLTHHPDSGSFHQATDAPPPTAKVKELLSKLADLPRAAEQKAQTEKELRIEIHGLKRQLKALPTRLIEAPVIQPDPRIVKANSLLKELVDEMYRIIVEHRMRLEKHGGGISEQVVRFQGEAKDVEAMHKSLARIERQMHARIQGLPDPPKSGKVIERANVVLPSPQSPGGSVTFSQEVKSAPPARKIDHLASGLQQASGLGVEGEGESKVTGPMMKILVTLAELAAIGKLIPPKAMVAGWAGYSPTSGGYANTLGMLRTAGLIGYPSPGHVGLTPEGEAIAGSMPPPSQDEVRRRIFTVCSGPEQKILQVLMEHGTEAMTKSEVAQTAGYSETSGGYANTLGMLRTKGFIDYPAKGMVEPAEWLFIE